MKVIRGVDVSSDTGDTDNSNRHIPRAKPTKQNETKMQAASGKSGHVVFYFFFFYFLVGGCSLTFEPIWLPHWPAWR